jgi:type VI secretion system protein ImpG
MPTVETFRLGCAPVVNLFSHTAEPIRLDQTQHEYRVIPEVRRPLASEIYSIDAVSLMSGETQTVRPVQPIYSLKHTRTDRDQSAFWYQTRRPSDRKGDAGTEVYVSLVDLALNPTVPAGDTLMLSTTCTNRGLTGRLPMDDPRGDFELEKGCAGGAYTSAGETNAADPAATRRRSTMEIHFPSLVELPLVDRGRSPCLTRNPAAVRLF